MGTGTLKATQEPVPYRNTPWQGEGIDNRNMPILSQADLNFFEENGYVVIHDAVPEGHRQSVMGAMEDFLGVKFDDPKTWYQAYTNGSGTIELYQHQALWDVRQYPKVHQAFSEIWKDEKLWVSIDRCGYKAPWSEAQDKKWRSPGFIHIDGDASIIPLPFAVQGVLYLTDTDENQGGFHCIPGFHKETKEWLRIAPPNGRMDSAEAKKLPEVKAIPGKAGDLLIWHRGLPHGSGKNSSDKLRLCQYFSMFLANKGWGSDYSDGRAEQRIRWWKERRNPEADCFPGDDRGWEAKHYGPAELTPLGKKLLGVAPW